MMEHKFRTTGEIYHDRISCTPLTAEAIKLAYAEMVREQTEDWNKAEPDERWDEGTPGELTRHNLGYILGYYDRKIREFWYKYLPEVNHPVFGEHFGRTYNPTPEIAFKQGQNLAKRRQSDG